MKLSYSEYRDYLVCPQRYKFIVDKTPEPEKENSYFRLYGLLMEKFFKKYTNYYTKKNITLNKDAIRNILSEQWDQILDENYVNWSEPYARETEQQIFERAYVDVLKNVETFNFWKDAKAEVSIDIALKKSQDILTCRLDFIWKRSDGTVEILDGKGTAKMDTNVDVDQLLFYALMYLLRYGKLPDKIGFLYYQYQIIKYVDFDMMRILAFRDKLVETKKIMKIDTNFISKVKFSKQCKWCVYKYVCKGYKVKREEKDNKKSKIEILENATGVIDMGAEVSV